MNISSRLIVNKAAMKMKHQAIQSLLDQFEKTLAKRG
jgi:ATP phosphoribosyltransferase